MVPLVPFIPLVQLNEHAGIRRVTGKQAAKIRGEFEKTVTSYVKSADEMKKSVERQRKEWRRNPRKITNLATYKLELTKALRIAQQVGRLARVSRQSQAISFIYLSIYLSNLSNQSINQSIYLSIYLSICVSSLGRRGGRREPAARGNSCSTCKV